MPEFILSVAAHGLSQGWPRIKYLSWLSCFVLIAPAAFAQALPQVGTAGVVNSASFATPVSPGSLVSIFGSNLAATTATATAQGTPLPTELVGTSVTFNGTKVSILFVSPSQINVVAPQYLQIALDAYTQASIVVTTAVGPSTPVEVPVYQSSPGVFTADGTGCGQALALNVSPDGSVSVNSPSNSAAPTDYIALFGTGLSFPYPLPDGATYATGPWPASPGADISIDGISAPVSYSGLAPMLVAVDQTNFRIQQGTREGCAVPVSVSTLDMLGPTVTVSIHSGRGGCVDPPIQSYGQLTLTKTTTSGTGNDGVTETLSADFPVAPGLIAPPHQQIPPFGGISNTVYSKGTISRTCPVAGYAQLSAGNLGIKALATGQTITALPEPESAGVSYQENLPRGFIGPGQYTVSAPGPPVAFQGTLAVGSPIEIQTVLVPGTQISSSQPLIVNWKGGDEGTVVKVSLVSILGQGVYSQSEYAYADAAFGFITIGTHCVGYDRPICVFAVPSSPNAEVVVEVFPAPINLTQIGAQGITGKIEFSWIYRYVFGGLSISY